jgi:FKBP-type peptidyl-prolyl cis-trans isomerase SlyD
MHITKDTVVTLTFRARDAAGKLLEDGSGQPRSYLHGGYGNTLPGIEKALEGQAPGFETSVTLTPEEAFGPRDESLVLTIPRSEFPPGVPVGGYLKGVDEQGREALFTVVKIKGQVVHLDGNHPLAGQTLQFDLKVLDVRAATPEEIAHGHAHGAHGHQH